MLNKKILAASIAATFALNANADVDLNGSTSDPALVYASEDISNGQDIAGAAPLNFKVNVGLNLPLIPTTAPFFVRIELTNAKFATNALEAGDLTISTAGTKTISKVGGGTTGSSFVVYDYDNTDTTTTSTDEFSFSFANGSATGLTVTDVTKPVTVTYKLYQNSDSLAALNGGAGAQVTTAFDAYTFATGRDVSGSFTAVNNTALVADQFTEFKDVGATTVDERAIVGTIQLKAKTGVLERADSSALELDDVYTSPTAQTATVTGDFSFGSWHVDTAATCGTSVTSNNRVVVSADKTSATVPSQNYSSDVHLCVVVNGTEVIPRVSTPYRYTIANNTGVAGNLGTIVYDTTAVTIPYVTTFADYNQRIYILNNSSLAAPYTTTFQVEEGVTATAGSAATGTVPAKTLLAIKASDLVTFTGRTRGAAVIEIEASQSNIEGTTQTVNLSDGSTDTVVLEVTGTN